MKQFLVMQVRFGVCIALWKAPAATYEGAVEAVKASGHVQFARYENPFAKVSAHGQSCDVPSEEVPPPRR
jgi:hypothetical protein